MKKKLVTFGISYCIVFLNVFMTVIFGPTEIFIGNYKDFGVVFNEFGWTFLICGIIGSVIISAIIALLPEVLRIVILSVGFGVGVACYIQGMFLNKGLDMLGATAEGYQAGKAEMIQNGVIWLALIVITLVLTCVLKKYRARIAAFGSLFLIAIQMSGYISLFFTADKEAFQYEAGELCLSGKEQFTVSSNENIIVFILDNFSSEWLAEAKQEVPGLTDGLLDFTYYNNADCNSYSTYPSLVRLVTGHELNPTVSVDDYITECWENEKTDDYYELLHEHGYKVNVYTPELPIICGSKTLSLATGKLDNVVQEGDTIQVNQKLLYKTLIKMSAYRYAPKCLKSRFNVGMNEYSEIVSYPDNVIATSNPNFYNALVENGLEVDDSSNYYQFIHLNGTHEFINDENCQYADGASRTQTIQGIFLMLNEYLKQLKEANAYDNSTIIITTDHGVARNMQPIFFIKEKGQKHDSMQESNAPISLNEFVPTVVNALGEDYSEFGSCIYDFSENEVRERTVYERSQDDAYPAVKRYDGGNAGQNVYHVYTYSGNLYDFQYVYDNGIYDVIPMVDSYF